MEILRNRTEIPLVTQDNRLVILPNETSKGRPIGEEYTGIDVKLKFMEIHGNIIKYYIRIENFIIQNYYLY